MLATLKLGEAHVSGSPFECKTGQRLRLRLWIENESGQTIRMLCDLPNGGDLVRWLKTNRDALLNEPLPSNPVGKTSIAAWIKGFYDKVDPENDPMGMVQAVYDYRQAHGLRFALRGMDVPDVYFRLFEEKYEVSIWNESEKWKYFIDLPVFLRSLK